MLRTRVYIDAFNLYYGSLKRTPYKWLNILSLSRRLVGGEPDLVRYFTARVGESRLDPGVHLRQEIYLKAIDLLGPKVVVHHGRYVQREKASRLAAPPHDRVTILHNEEKGSDVNLATHLLVDAFEDKFDAAYVVTNDSDLAEPVQHVRDTMKKKIYVVNPHKSTHKSWHLVQACTSTRHLRREVVRLCQLEDPFKGIAKPSTW